MQQHRRIAKQNYAKRNKLDQKERERERRFHTPKIQKCKAFYSHGDCLEVGTKKGLPRSTMKVLG